MINKEKFKWVAVFTALILLFAGVITSLAIAIGNKPVEVKTEGQDVSAAAEDNPMVKSKRTQNEKTVAVEEINRQRI